MRLELSNDGIADDCPISGVDIFTQRPLPGFEGAKKIKIGLDFHLTQTLGDVKITITMSRDEAANLARRLLATAGQDESECQHPTAKRYE